MTDTKPNIIEGPTDDGFDSVLSQSLSDDLHRDILTLTSRLISNTAHTNDLHIVDRGIYSLMESLVVIAKNILRVRRGTRRDDRQLYGPNESDCR